MTKNNIWLYGALQRHNYGDLLLAQILAAKYQSCSDVEVKGFIAPTAGDTRPWGGVEALGILSIRDYLTPGESVVAVGGDIYAIDWVDTLGHAHSDGFHLFLKAIRKVLGGALTNRLIRFLTAGPSLSPYFIDEKTQNKLGVGFKNAPGGASGFTRQMSRGHTYLRDFLPLYKKLSLVHALPVRDKDSLATLQSLGINAVLVPDMAMLLANQEVRQRIFSLNPECANNFAPARTEIVFQCMNLPDAMIARYTQQIIDLSRKTRIKIRLLALGLAPGHRDDLALQKVYVDLEKAGLEVVLDTSGNIGAIAKHIFQSRLYIGTSLHGSITAFCGGVPVIALATSRIPKLKSFIDTWMSGFHAICPEDDNFVDLAFDILSNSSYVYDNTRAQIVADKALLYFPVLNA